MIEEEKEKHKKEDHEQYERDKKAFESIEKKNISRSLNDKGDDTRKE